MTDDRIERRRAKHDLAFVGGDSPHERIITGEEDCVMVAHETGCLDRLSRTQGTGEA